jgi:hypothetical protein
MVELAGRASKYCPVQGAHTVKLTHFRAHRTQLTKHTHHQAYLHLVKHTHQACLHFTTSGWTTTSSTRHFNTLPVPHGKKQPVYTSIPQSRGKKQPAPHKAHFHVHNRVQSTSSAHIYINNMYSQTIISAFISTTLLPAHVISTKLSARTVYQIPFMHLQCECRVCPEVR